jgi:uncharacterized membrane protein YgdD (TMEM256/DUF423 family)
MFLSVAAGAFGAHALKSRLSSDMLSVFETGARYQAYHSLALLAVALLLRTAPSKAATAAGWCFMLGVYFFSGSLYALALSGIKLFGAITPIGGLLFLAGWACLAAVAL